ncbi:MULTISPECIES: hypothetical protein [Candidatus Ichthyocystis]|uniref:Putative coiled coil protein n=1 Tax=Candidatus Ichthyocystis hellenicum TaxID=1561003 RepID=A0A0S4M5H4_9BURK|nr:MULTISPECIES: hypothetical protein [Ichthyocystis]CUT18162.1 putative coiled coil protein [Candidatus Ichthyocystis hellenicum]
MKIINYRNPCSLVELSMKAVLGVDCEGSIDNLMQLSPREAIEAAIIVSNRMAANYRTKYESVIESFNNRREHIEFFENSSEFSLYNDYSLYSPSCNFMEFEALNRWKESVKILINVHDRYSVISQKVHERDHNERINPIYKLIYSDDISDLIGDYYNRKDRNFFLPDLIPYDIEIDKTYLDPLQFFDLFSSGHIYSFNASSLLTEIVSASLKVIKNLNESMDILEKSCHCIRKKLYCLIVSSCSQAKHAASLLETAAENRSNYDKHKMSFEKENLSLDVLTCFRNFMESVFNIKEIINIMEFFNFVPLEDVSRVLKRNFSTANDVVYKISRSEFRMEVNVISSFLIKKYESLISKKKLRMKKLLRKINPNNKVGLHSSSFQPVFVKCINQSVEKIRNEIRELETMMISLSENKPRIKKSRVKKQGCL